MSIPSEITGCGLCAHIQYMGKMGMARCLHPDHPATHAITARKWGHCGPNMNSREVFGGKVPTAHSIPRIEGQQ